MSDLLEELQWRGLIAQHSDWETLTDALNSGPVTFYCGFDPTAPSLHHGHLVQVIIMRHLQRAGHHALALVGGGTGLIGDPRASGERSLQSTDVVAGWADGLRAQLERLLDFTGDNPARMVNNLDWIGSLSAIELMRDLGKYFRMGTMLNKDIVARRLESDEGLSYTEFSYQVLQAYDYLELYRRYGCTLETGGNDQWGNLVGGMDLIRKVEGKQVSVLTSPIITKADGTKFGKTEGGAIWLDPQLMSPYAFYQFWLQTSDDDVIRFLKIFTFLSRGEIEELEQQVREAPHLRAAQKRLAAEVTAYVHGAEALAEAESATAALWAGGDLRSLSASVLGEAVEKLPRGHWTPGETTLTEAMVSSGLEKGRAAARRTIESNGLSVNNEKNPDPEYVLQEADALPGGVILLRKGRRNLAVLARD
ncbi:tyrosine--tRNA ligase [Scrofimicrobium sp. R131]|uniref:Tyrosine--tRNA ligase n=1 Tax=Scrofimicrobium appendicitidis TaxID=3079930 RepID=A0AAU7VAT8_9ACTO